jgi:twitching motility protein PilT
MRDYETVSAAVTAAETGVLLFSTLHTSSVANTINRIVDVYPAEQQMQVRIQLSQLLRGVVCQKLVPTKNDSLVPAFEVMRSTPAIQNMIREGKFHQLESVMQSSVQEGMVTMDGSLVKLCQDGIISKETALAASNNFEFMKKRLGL